ncbi:MAG TPA: copper-binding protein [Burkholderiales bacterium]|jgi:Cu(I)/Ag(I) efflux system protein CusF|nr:copper-binding protein [Burkholderiales bacterium]
MRTGIALTAVLLALPLAAMGQPGGHDPAGRSAAAAQPGTIAPHRATGVVKSVDRQQGKVTLAHGPVASLQWPAMTMAFAVQDRALLDKLSAERKVEFEFVQQGKQYVITRVK